MLQPRQQHKMLLVKDGKCSNARNCDSNVSQYEAFYSIILKWNTKLDHTSKKMKPYESSLYRQNTGSFYIAQIVVFKSRH